MITSLYHSTHPSLAEPLEVTEIYENDEYRCAECDGTGDIWSSFDPDLERSECCVCEGSGLNPEGRLALEIAHADLGPPEEDSEEDHYDGVLVLLARFNAVAEKFLAREAALAQEEAEFQAGRLALGDRLRPAARRA